MKQLVLMGRTAIIAASLAVQAAHADAVTNTNWDSVDYSYSQLEANLRVFGDSPDALRTIGLMRLYGERLYGSEIVKDCPQALISLQKAEALGDPVATLVLPKAKTACGKTSLVLRTGN